MTPVAAAVATAVLVVCVLAAERTGRWRVGAAAKTAASIVFVAVALSRWHPGDLPGAWLVAGLVLGAAGDLLLALPGGFVPGLAVFLAGHAAYAGAFAAMVPVGAWPLSALGPVALTSAVALRVLWPHLGRLRWAVTAYVAVITVMVWGAAAAGTGVGGRWRLAGAVAFYLSDLFVARNRFVRRRFLNRAVGLPLYYAGQLLIACSIGVS